VKLVRIGRPGNEYPGAIDSEGGLRDLSTIVADIAGSALLPGSLAKLRGINLATLPRVSGSPRLGQQRQLVVPFASPQREAHGHESALSLATPAVR